MQLYILIERPVRHGSAYNAAPPAQCAREVDADRAPPPPPPPRRSQHERGCGDDAASFKLLSQRDVDLRAWMAIVGSISQQKQLAAASNSQQAASEPVAVFPGSVNCNDYRCDGTIVHRDGRRHRLQPRRPVHTGWSRDSSVSP